MSVPSRAPAPRDDSKGYLVTPISPTPFGKYTIIGKLGHGGMAEVNLAVVGGKGGFRKLFVVKRLHAHLEAEAGFVDMFLDEARLAAQLDHPNCVQTVEVGEANGQHFLAMEFLDGQGLERILRITGQRGDILPVHMSVRMIADALDGLGYAHDLRGYDGTPLGVVHRDVSPQNIFVTYAGVVKLLDFGIAKAESNVVETRTGVVKGKYAYIAPEQALAAPVDQRADLWSMGVVLWELLTSRRLFKSVNELATLNETLRGEVHPPSHYNPQVPPELDRVVLHALQRDVEQRFRTAHEFKDALEGWLATQREQPDRKAIAALMKERFGDIIEQHKARLKDCIASVAQDPRSLDRLVLGTASSSSSMEADALSSGSHPGLAGSGGLDGSGARSLAGASSPSMTPTPSPRPRLGASVSGSITSGLPQMGEIAPRVSQPGGSPHGSSQQSLQRRSSSGAHAVASGAYGLGGGLASGTTSSAEWVAASSPGFAPPPVPTPPPAGASGAFGADQTTRMPQKRSPSRSIAWWLIGLAACVVSAVVGIVTWTAMHQEPAAVPLGGAAPTEIVLGPDVATAPPTPGTTTSPAPAQPTTPSATTPPVAGQPVDPSQIVADPSLVAVEPQTVVDGRSPRGSRRHDRSPRAAQPAVSTTVTPPPPAPEQPAPETERPEDRSASHGPGFLSLVTSPWTQVTLDGRSLGETPLVRVSLPPGTHTLRLRNAEADIDESYEVTIRAGETTTRRLGLR